MRGPGVEGGNRRFCTVGMAVVLFAMPTLPAIGMTEGEHRMAVQRACEVAIWALPAVSTYDIANAIERDLGGALGDVVYMSQPMTSRHGFLTANDVTPYAVAALSTKDGPLVVEVPPASAKTTFFGTFVDAWMRPVADVGPNGADAGRGGKYLFLPPGYDGRAPEGYLAFRLDTYGVNFAFRPVSRNGGAIPEAVDYAKRLRVYALVDAKNPPATKLIDAYPHAWNTLPTYDLTYFEDLWNVVQREPVLPRDKAMMGLLASIGIEKGRPFRPSTELREALEAGVACAFEYLQERFTTPGGALVPYFPERSQWQAFNIPADQAAAGFPFESETQLLSDLRAVNYFYVTYLPKTLGAGTLYLTGLRDRDGALLTGQNTYRLRVPADTPARDFWSVIVYDMRSKGFVEKVDRVGISSRDKDRLVVESDGAVNVYFGPTPPKGYEANWLETGDDFFVLFRFYGPEKPILEKSWVLPDIEKVR